jgi:hypothetical protein
MKVRTLLLVALLVAISLASWADDKPTKPDAVDPEAYKAAVERLNAKTRARDEAKARDKENDTPSASKATKSPEAKKLDERAARWDASKKAMAVFEKVDYDRFEDVTTRSVTIPARLGDANFSLTIVMIHKGRNLFFPPVKRPAFFDEAEGKEPSFYLTVTPPAGTNFGREAAIVLAKGERTKLAPGPTLTGSERAYQIDMTSLGTMMLAAPEIRFGDTEVAVTSDGLRKIRLAATAGLIVDWLIYEHAVPDLGEFK